MEPETSEKITKPRSGVTLTLEDIPAGVHRKLVRYQRKIMGERDRKYNIKQAYIEFLKEMTAPKPAA